MEYINYIKAKAHISTASKSDKPVLSEEDEAFLRRITSDDQPPPLPVRAYKQHGGDAQIALMDGAHNISLPPVSPSEQDLTLSDEPESFLPATKEVSGDQGAEPKRKTWNWLRRDSRDSKKKRNATTAAGLHDIAEGIKSPGAQPNEDDQVSDAEAKKEEEDMTVVLETLNLAAVNNRVFSISDETQELLQKFNQVFKDLVKGVPTAYNDLESLLTNGDQQLQKTYNSLPPFLQKLIEKLPETVTKGIGPEIMAAASERASKTGINVEKAGKAVGMASKLLKTPSLKDLIGKPGAVAGMLRSIVTFLRARFPAFMGMNVLWSLALFVLLFVFWYCHKRGREVRLDKERDLTEQEIQRMETEYKATVPSHAYTTTANPGAPLEEVHAGMQEAEAVRAARAAFSHTANVNPNSLDYKPSKAAHTRKMSTGH